MWRVTLLAIAACASIDPPPELVTPLITVTNNPVAVTTPELELDFAATGTHLPDHLISKDGSELLGIEDPCMGSSQIGYAVSPAVSASAGMTGTGVRSTITVVQPGPVIAKVHVTFEVNYNCPSAETLQGSTDFTIFPTGRIVREDIAVQPSTDTLGKTGSCGCQQETNSANFQNLSFGTFYAFVPAGATQVYPDGTAVGDGAYAACTMYPGRAVGVSFENLPGTTVRYHAQTTASHALEWVTNQTSLASTPRSMTSALQVSNTAPASTADCNAIIDRLADVPLVIDNARMGNSGHDGIYRDTVPHTAPFVIKPEDQSLPPGWAISVDLGGANHATIERSPPTTAHPAMVQREEGTTFLIFFPDGLARGETITITPTS